MKYFLDHNSFVAHHDILYDETNEYYKTKKTLGLIKNYSDSVLQVKYMNDYAHEYFTIISVGEDPLIITGINISVNATVDQIKNISYSLDDGLTWTTTANASNKTEDINCLQNTITLNYGERICLRGNAKTFYDSTNTIQLLTFSFSNNNAKFEIAGNVMSLFYNSDFYNKNFTNENSGCLSGFLNEQKMLVSAENLVLPSMFVPELGYEGMFYGCRNLLYAPKVLPAKILSRASYSVMFYGCKRLIKGPDIKALQPFIDMNFPGKAGSMGIVVIGEDPPYVGRKGKTRWDNVFTEMFVGCSDLHYIGCDLTNLNYVYYYISQSSIRPGLINDRVNEKTILFTDGWCDNEYYATETEDTTYYDSSDPSIVSGYYNMFSKYGVFVKNRNAKYDNSQGISSIPEHWEIVYSDKKEYFFKPLTFKALEDSTIFYFTKTNTVSSDELYYSLDEGKTWTQCNFTDNVFTSPTLNNGDTISWKGNLTHPAIPQRQTLTYVHVYNINGGIGSFKTNIVNNKYKNYDIYGNIESLVHNDEFIYGKGINFKTTQNNTEQYVEGLFFGIFKLPTILENSGPVNAENLILGAMDLSDHCYEYMFQNCTALQTAPELLAIKMAKWCYAGMFMECYSLPITQKLPAEELAEGCYASMYDWCTKLTIIDKDMLPATEMKNRCYFGLFNGCINLVLPPDLPATSLYIDPNPNPNTDKTYGWVYAHMFSSCVKLNVVPELPATTLSEWCYAEMFKGCNNIVSAQSVLPATTLAPECYAAMFSECPNLVVPPVLPATSLIKFCYQSMFQYCTSLKTAPELPAESLVQSCYAFMFKGCTNLNYIKAMFKSVPDSYNVYDEGGALSSWVEDVSPSGTFIKNSTATWSNDLDGVIPSDWTVQTSAS